MFWDGRTEENSWVSVGFYFLSKSWQSKDQLLFSFCFLVSVGFPRLLVSFVALLTSSSSSPERGVSWCSCSGGGGHFLPLCMLLAVSLASLWGQRPNQVSECRLKQHFRSQAGAGCHFWMASDVAQVKRDGTWCRDKADTSGWVTFSSWQMCCLELLFKTIKKKILGKVLDYSESNLAERLSKQALHWDQFTHWYLFTLVYWVPTM